MAKELDIKSIWQKGKALEDPSSLPINTLEKKGTKTTLYWIKIILWIEFWLNIVMLPVFIPYLKSRGDGLGFIIFYTVLTLVYLAYYQFLIKKINQFSYDGNVLKSLKKVYGYLRFFLLHYKVVIWVSVILGSVYGIIDEQNSEAFEKVDTLREWAIVIAIYAVVSIIVAGIMQLLVNLIYGRKIKRLRKTIKDLEIEE